MSINNTPAPHQVVADLVKAEMERQGVSQPTLAKHLGVAQATVWRRLCGEVAFDVTELSAVAEFLGVPVTQFLPGEAAA